MQLHQAARSKQAGFSVIEALLVVLVIAALAVIGYVVYQRHKPISTKNSAATSQTQITTQPATQYLTIKEWGVKIPLSDSIKDAYYVAGISSKGSDGLPNQMWIGLKSLDGNGCTATSNSGPALIFRALPTDTDPVSGQLLTQKYPNGATIGNHYYGYEDFTTSSSNTCKAPQTTLQTVHAALANAATSTQLAPSVDAYPGWKSAELTNEKLGFQYPSDWKATIIKNGENIAVQSPIVNGHYIVVVLQAGPGDTTLNLNLLGNASGTTIAKLTVPGSTIPLYLDAETVGDQNTVACLGLATTPGSQNHDTAFGILDANGKGQHNIVMYACLTPITATLADNGAEYSMQAYTSNKYYPTVIRIFQSLHYEQ